jgi:hypothetical protein
MHIPNTKVWFSKKWAKELELIESRDITTKELKAEVKDLAERMVKHARQNRLMIPSVFEFLWEK